MASSSCQRTLTIPFVPSAGPTWFCRAVHTSAAMAWKPPALFRSPFAKPTRSFPKSIRVPPGSASGPSRNPPTSGGPPPQSDLDRGLFASNPELEQLAIKSTDAPILVRVVSYNILSSSLASPSHFSSCDPANLSASVRLKRVLTKLEGPVASRSIICLQEVSLAWSGPLHTFFANRGFHLLLASHGSYLNGYMGEGLAFPLDLFEPIDLRIERLTDMMDWPTSAKGAGAGADDWMGNVARRVGKAWKALFGEPGGGKSAGRRKTREPWEHARGRLNRLIFARLKSRTNGGRICVGTYHMPCIYWSPPVMMIHAGLVVRSFQGLCGEDDGVLAGDFNIKPTDGCYKMIVSGTVDEASGDFPTASPDGTAGGREWFPRPMGRMKSAYHEVLGAEPEFTNFAKVEGQDTFVETLDYMFCTTGVDVVDVLQLPRRAAVAGPLPDAHEPSDHVMIGATLRLAAHARQGVGAVTATEREMGEQEMGERERERELEREEVNKGGPSRRQRVPGGSGSGGWLRSGSGSGGKNGF